MSLSICSLCDTEITSAEIIISSSIKLCQDCSNCSTCHKQVTIDQIRLCLSNKIPIKHDNCARVPHRRCIHLDERGQQCDTWFKAIDKNKLCEAHRDILTPNGKLSEENKVKYIDLVNDERSYCYHFLDGIVQNQDSTLIHEFKDDLDGSVYDKIDARIAFFEKIIEDVKARLHSARVTKSDKLDALNEEERAELRKQKIDKAFKPEKEKVKSFKSDPIGNLMKKNSLSKDSASALLDLDPDAFLARFEAAKKNKENK